MSGLAAGAKAGAAFGPWGAAIGGVAGAASDAINAAMGGPFMGGDSKATYGDIDTDHSGWTVNVGSGSASTNNAQTKTKTRTTTDVDPAGMGLIPGALPGGYGSPMAPVMQAGINPMMLLVLGSVALGLALRRRRT